MNKCLVCGTKMEILLKELFDDRYGAPCFYDIYQCPKCGFGRTSPVLEKEEIGEFYKKHYPLSHLTSTEVKNYAKVSSKFSAWWKGTDNTTHWHVKKGADVLDIGSGSGVSLLEIQQIGANAFGVEPDPSAQALARRLNLKVYKGFITDNPFPGKKFDFITASQVIEHEPDPLIFLIAAEKKLKDDGKIILSFPNKDSFYREIFGGRWINWHVPYHINHFSRKSFVRLADKARLKVIKMRTITPNLWSDIQRRSLSVAQNKGKPSPVWVSGVKRSGDGSSQSNFLRRILSELIDKGFLYLIMPINRIIDFLGRGDSFWVYLSKR